MNSLPFLGIQRGNSLHSHDARTSCAYCVNVMFYLKQFSRHVHVRCPLSIREMDEHGHAIEEFTDHVTYYLDSRPSL